MKKAKKWISVTPLLHRLRSGNRMNLVTDLFSSKLGKKKTDVAELTDAHLAHHRHTVRLFQVHDLLNAFPGKHASIL
jgi:hypothetical protein